MEKPKDIAVTLYYRHAWKSSAALSHSMFGSVAYISFQNTDDLEQPLWKSAQEDFNGRLRKETSRALILEKAGGMHEYEAPGYPTMHGVQAATSGRGDQPHFHLDWPPDQTLSQN